MHLEDHIYNIYTVKRKVPDVLIATVYNKQAAEMFLEVLSKQVV